MKNIIIIAAIFCLFANYLHAQVVLTIDPAIPVQGGYSKVWLDGQLENLDSIKWEITNGKILNIVDLNCSETDSTQTCTTASTGNGIAVLWDCILNQVPQVIARTIDTNGNEQVYTITGQTYNSPPIVAEETNYCIGQTSLFSANIIEGSDKDYVWKVTGNAAEKTDIKTYTEDGKSWAAVTWGDIGNAQISLTTIVGNNCELQSTYNSAILVKKNPNTPAINGPTSVCNYGTFNYTITPELGVVEYEWIMPLGATDNQTGEVRVVTNTPNLTVKFSEKFENGMLTVVARNTCGGENQNALMLYSGNPALKSVVEGETAISGIAQRAYSFNVPGANWYEWNISGPDSSIATIKTDPHQASIYVDFNTPSDETEKPYYLEIKSKAYEQEGGCPLSSNSLQLRADDCPGSYISNQNYNHDVLYNAQQGTSKILNGLETEYCQCNIAEKKVLNINAMLDIRCPSSDTDKDYMFGSGTDFNLFLDAELLLYNGTGNLLATIPFTFNVSPNNPKQQFSVLLKNNTYGISNIEDVGRVFINLTMLN